MHPLKHVVRSTSNLSQLGVKNRVPKTELAELELRHHLSPFYQQKNMLELSNFTSGA